MATIIAPAQHQPDADADVLRKACEGWGSDDNALISVIGHRNASQRKSIRQSYQELYGEDLVHRLEKEISGNFERSVYRWMFDPVDRDAILLNVAIKKSDYRVIAEICCVQSSDELLAVKRAYQSRYKHSLEEDVASHTTADIRMLLVGLVSSYRYEGVGELNSGLVESEAEILHKAFIQNKGFNDEEVIRILTTRSKFHLVATFNNYREAYGISITKSLDAAAEESSEYLSAIGTAIRCIADSNKYFVKVLRAALSKRGTDDDGITRVIVTRAEKDMKEIKDLYFKMNSVTLEQEVAKETSGSYEVFLLTILGKEELLQ